MTHGWHDDRKQYYIYELDSFIADVGGYMGLLLGFSMLSIYNELDGLLRKMKAWLGARARKPALTL